MLDELIIELMDRAFINEMNRENNEFQELIKKYRDNYKFTLINRYRHKELGIIGVEKEDGHLHYERCYGNMCSVESIHMDFIRNGVDWENLNEK